MERARQAGQASTSEASAGETQDAVEQARRWLAERGIEPTDVGSDDGSTRPTSTRPTSTRPTSTPRSPEPDAVDSSDADDSSDDVAGVSQASSGARTPGVAAGLDPEADPESVARTIVLRKLAVQARTRAELAKALRAKQVPDDAAHRVLDRMEAVGLIDDVGFARDWVESRQQRRHLSRSALRRELNAKGVDRDEIDSALEAVDPADELGAARELAQRRLKSMASLDRQVQYRRLAGVLQRRGFSGAVVSRVLGEVLDTDG